MTVSNRPNLGMAIGYIGVPKYIYGLSNKKKVPQILQHIGIIQEYKV